jgi:hypothetical protein
MRRPSGKLVRDGFDRAGRDHLYRQAAAMLVPPLPHGSMQPDVSGDDDAVPDSREAALVVADVHVANKVLQRRAMRMSVIVVVECCGCATPSCLQ